MKDMNLRSLAIMAFMSMASATAMAQASFTSRQGDEYVFRKHAFIDLQGGVQYTLGEAKFKDLISPNVQVGIGYQFTPVFAMRLQANGWQGKGGWNGYRAKVGDEPCNASYKFNYVAPGIDFMFNLSNLFCGWNPNRVLNISAFAGGGANVAWKNDEANAIAEHVKNLDAYNLEYLWQGTKVRPFGRAGVDVELKVSQAVSIMIEGNANVLSDKYNSKKAGNPDWYFNALAGLRINLGKSHVKKDKPIEESPAPALMQEYVAPKPQPKPAPVEEKKAEEITRHVFFVINSSRISQTEDAKVKEVADFLKSHPEAQVSIVGYADAGTGNNVINDRISKRRAQSVAKQLCEKYGIDKSRMTVDAKGARIQPFAENNKNRVTIVFAQDR